MTDDEVQKLDQLFDKKLSPLNEQLGSLNRSVETGFAAVHGELNAANQSLDTVAGHLAKVDERLSSVEYRLTNVEKTQVEHSNKLDKIDRTLSNHLDRMDDHGERIEALEAKTGHLPTPPPRRR